MESSSVPKCSANKLETIANDGVEMAYILLPNVQVTLETGDKVETGKSWRPLRLVERSDAAETDPSAANERKCPCQVAVLQVGGEFQVSAASIKPFNGFENEVICKECRQARSDAALLLGLMQAAQPDAQVRELCIHAHSTSRASLLVTVVFPNLLQGKPGSRSILKKHKSVQHNKPLSSALQLLLSIVRTDWAKLEASKQFLESERLQESTHGSTFFPARNALEELYRRIPATQNDLLDGSGGPTNTESSLLLSLNDDILADKMAPFLNAASLDALRCSCKRLFRSLRAVVPGLKLRLYKHQIRSLSWMRERECRGLSEQDTLESMVGGSLDGDLHRAVTGGATVLLRSRDGGTNLHIDQYAGNEVDICEDTELRAVRSVARGGLLCDDPGLGKTITVLSLALQTLGLTTTRDDSRIREAVKSNEVAGDEDLFRVYWSEQVTRDFRLPILHKLLNELLRVHRGSGFFPVDQLRRDIAKDVFGSDFETFEVAVKNAVSLYAPDDETKTGSRTILSEFEALVEGLRKRQMQSAKKSFSNPSARPRSRVAAVLGQQSQQKFVESLVPSKGTLLVIPHVLMEHWQSQISMHVDPKYVTTKEPIIFEYGKKNDKLTADKVTILCQLRKTHAPLVFLDKSGTRALPSAEFLAMFPLVITTTDRFKSEWANGSFQRELRCEDTETEGPSYRNWAYRESAEACPLLKVNWLRMVVDEGHSMSKGGRSSTIQFASWIVAQRRWAMTGTPTKQTSNELIQVKGLMSFLQHDFFSAALDGERSWRTLIFRPWSHGNLVAFFRLQALLGLLMKRHTKLDISELSPPNFQQEVIPMSFIEAMTYNTLVCGVQTNILLTSMEGKTSGEQDSLLHRSQARHAREALANIRRVCVGWSRVVPTLTLEHFMETVHLLGKHGFDQRAVDRVREYLVRPELEELTPCGCCGIKLSTPLLLPCCAGLICPECMNSKSTSCLLCDREFDVDDFQRLQPGFVLTWKSNLESKKTGNQRKGSPPESAVVEPAVADVILRPVQQRRRTKKFGDGHACVYDRYAADGMCVLCFQEHDSCNLINCVTRCETCFRLAESCPVEESKGSYLVRKLGLMLASRNESINARPVKVIVYSQFRKALDVVGDRLLKKFGTACVAEYWGRFRTQELHKFTCDNACFCMLLSNDGSEGLDLSFVTHIFFLEEIWEKSRQNQVVARAWRMGSKGAVEVETLIAKNSVEETMQEMESVARKGRSFVSDDGHVELLDGLDPRKLQEYHQEKTRFLLRSLRLVTDYHYFASESPMLDQDGLAMFSRKRKQAAVDEDAAANTEILRQRRMVCFHFPDCGTP